MGTFAGTPIVDYHLSFTNQGKQTSVFRIYIYPYIFIYLYVNINLYAVYICVCVYLYIYPAISNGKLKPRRFSLFCLPFAHRANGSLTLGLFVDEETNRSYPFANGPNGLGRLWVYTVCKREVTEIWPSDCLPQSAIGNRC
jgi:hypothetical protein